MEKDKNYYIGCLIGFIIVVILGIVIWNWWSNLWDSSSISSSSYSSSSSSGKATNLEIMSYAQTVLDKKLGNPSYSHNENDYTIVNTNLRYKIEGKVNNEKFWMIIEFVDDTYKEYDLISLQVGNKRY